MMMQAAEFVAAAKVPDGLLPWLSPDHAISAKRINGDAFLFDSVSWAGIHLVDENGIGGYTIMDDSDREIRRHMAAIMAAKGRVLKTGLGFGCFVRACLRKPEVEHIDVIEIDRNIIDHFGAEFAGNPRVTLHHADAFKFPLKGRHWSLCWHDIYCDGNDGLQVLHNKLLLRYRRHCDIQGAWALPRWVARIWAERHKPLVGSPRFKVRALAADSGEE